MNEKIKDKLPPISAQLFNAKAKKKLTFAQIGDIINRDEIWVAAVFYGQAKLDPEDLEKLSIALDISLTNLNDNFGSSFYPNKGGLIETPPRDPLIYRLYEILEVYGYPLKAVIHEKFGDGIMSAVDFTAKVDKFNLLSSPQRKKKRRVMSETEPLLQERPPQKRVAIPVRVEPKVFFANERTFLSWLQFTVVLGGLAIGLLNFGDRVGKISAALFTFVAMAVMIYALSIYHWRADRIRKREGGAYDDRFGPTILCIFLLAAVITNFALRFSAGF
ncbi:hypothetical protein G9A89_018112 [Geosiphon pyriformis]|nr:hypothetical protein G9A89_018112 [Geosiphon pyriformis]